MGAAIYFPEDARQVTWRLGGDMIEIDAVANAMTDSEGQSSQCHNFVETNVRVKRNVVVQHCFSEVGDKISCHGDKKNRIGEHHTRSSTTGDCHTISSNPSEACKLSLN